MREENLRNHLYRRQTPNLENSLLKLHLRKIGGVGFALYPKPIPKNQKPKKCSGP